MRIDYLAVLVVQQIGLVAVEHADGAAVDRRRVPACPYAVPAGLHAGHPDLLVIEKGMEEAHSVRPAADARHKEVREPSGKALYLLTRFNPDDRLEVPHEHRIGVRACNSADYVKCVIDVCDTCPERLVHGVLQGP